MRLLRVALTDVRGIAATDVTFAADGVTILSAPNEAGKTTLLEAVDVALTYKDSSRHRDVQSLWPVDRDGPVTVEVELTCGPHHLVLTRSYRRQPGTVLVVRGPQPATLTGGDAHDRLRTLLESEVDLDLFEALRFTQGRDLDAVALGGSGVLAARLDAAATARPDAADGQAPATPADDGDLLDRVTAEFSRWFTATGRPGRALTEIDARVEALAAEHLELTARLAALEQDVEDLARVERELPEERRHRTEELEPRLAVIEDASRAVTAATGVVSQREAALMRAETAAAEAARAHDERTALVERAQQLGELVVGLEADAAPAAERLVALERELGRLDREVVAAEQEATRSRVVRERAQLELDLAVARIDRERLQGRLATVDAVLAGARAAERELAGLGLDDDGLAGIRALAEQLRVAEATLRAGAPSVTLLAHRPLAVHTGLDDEDVATGSRIQRTVTGVLRLAVPDVLDLEVRAGGSSEDLAQTVEDAAMRLREACRSLGVADAADAERVAGRRRGLEDVLARRDADVERELGGADVEDLRGAVRAAIDHEQRLLDQVMPGTGGSASGAEPDLDPTMDPDAARAARDAAVTADTTADDALARVRSAREALRAEVGELRARAFGSASTIQARRDDLELQTRLLDEARAVADDEDLATRMTAAAGAVAAARDELDAARRELAALDPEAVELERDNLHRLLDDARDRISVLEQRQAGLRASLHVRGEEGLGELVSALEQRLEHARGEHRRRWTRAAAARLLHEELRTARDEAYRAYRAPLRDRIGRLAGLLYGHDAEVELDDELRIVSRTVGAVTLAWDQLSAGAREQLAILSALAAAELAGPDGVPFVLDDALGYTDPQRLERLGALLGRSVGAQVIVLTCVPGRFRHVGGARMVTLDTRVADAPTGDRGR